MAETPSSDKILGLFVSFRENEAEFERMDVQLKQKLTAQEKVQRQLDSVVASVTQMDMESHRLKRALVKEKEQIRSLEPQLMKEKDMQYAIYIELVQMEETAGGLERDGIESQLEAARAVRKQSASYLKQRNDCVDKILRNLGGASY